MRFQSRNNTAIQKMDGNGPGKKNMFLPDVPDRFHSDATDRKLPALMEAAILKPGFKQHG